MTLMKGSISYKNGNTYEYWYEPHKISIYVYSHSIAVLRFVDRETGTPIPPPRGCRLHYLHDQSDIRAVDNAFLIAQTDNVELRIKDICIMTFYNQRQIAVEGNINANAVLQGNVYKRINGRRVSANDRRIIETLEGRVLDDFVRYYNRNPPNAAALQVDDQPEPESEHDGEEPEGNLAQEADDQSESGSEFESEGDLVPVDDDQSESENKHEGDEALAPVADQSESENESESEGNRVPDLDTTRQTVRTPKAAIKKSK